MNIEVTNEFLRVLHIKMDENNRCYAELSVTEELPINVKSECMGREILQLQPIECEGPNESGMLSFPGFLIVACTQKNFG